MKINTTSLLIHLFDKYLENARYMSDAVLGPGNTRIIFTYIHLVFKYLSFWFFFFHDFSKSLTGGSPIPIFSQAWKLLISLTLISRFDSSCILDFYFFFHLLIPFQPFTFLSHFLFLYIMCMYIHIYFFFFYSLLACGLPSQSKNKSVKRAMSVDFAGDCTCWKLGGRG